MYKINIITYSYLFEGEFSKYTYNMNPIKLSFNFMIFFLNEYQKNTCWVPSNLKYSSFSAFFRLRPFFGNKRAKIDHKNMQNAFLIKLLVKLNIQKKKSKTKASEISANALFGFLLDGMALDSFTTEMDHSVEAVINGFFDWISLDYRNSLK